MTESGKIRQMVREAIAETRDGPVAADSPPAVTIPITLRSLQDREQYEAVVGRICASPGLGNLFQEGKIRFDVRDETGGAGGPTSRDGDAAALAAFYRFFDAFNTGDVEQIWRTVTDDFEWRLPAGPATPYGQVARGKEQFRKAYEKRWGFLKHLKGTNEHVIAAGGRVAQYYRVTGTTPDGREIDFYGTDFYWVRDGKIAIKDAFNKNITAPAGSDGGAGAAAAGGKGLRIANGVVSERRVKEAAQLGSRITLGPEAVITPLGKDLAKKLGVTIEREKP